MSSNYKKQTYEITYRAMNNGIAYHITKECELPEAIGQYEKVINGGHRDVELIRTCDGRVLLSNAIKEKV